MSPKRGRVFLTEIASVGGLFYFSAFAFKVSRLSCGPELGARGRIGASLVERATSRRIDAAPRPAICQRVSSSSLRYLESLYLHTGQGGKVTANGAWEITSFLDVKAVSDRWAIAMPL
jgi:hypothetical protein